MSNYSYEDVNRAERDIEAESLTVEIANKRDELAAAGEDFCEWAKAIGDATSDYFWLMGELSDAATRTIRLAGEITALRVDLATLRQGRVG